MDELGIMRITDRTKDPIKSGGEWISLVDLGERADGAPAVAEAAVIAIPTRSGANGRWPASCSSRAGAAEDAGERTCCSTVSPGGSCPSASR